MKDIPYQILDQLRCVKNWFVCKRYPWLKINNVGYHWLDNRYISTWYDEIPSGWRKRFGKQLIRDIDKYLKVNKITDYHIDQVKEKFGELRWYDNSDKNFYEQVFKKYETLSRYTCINCGRPAEYLSTGWITPYCGKCVKKIQKRHPQCKFTSL